VEKAVKQALDMMVAMREKEGAHLAQGFGQAHRHHARFRPPRAKRAPQVQVKYREQLMERIQNAGMEAVKVEEERILKEVIFFADRSDISEEITRLQSHFKQFDDCVNSARAGRAHAGFPGPGDEPGDQHHRLEGQRRNDLARCGGLENRVGEISRAGAERGMKGSSSNVPTAGQRQEAGFKAERQPQARVGDGQAVTNMNDKSRSRAADSGPANTAPLLFVISAPSGGGKTTLCQELLAARKDITRAITCTTRAPRPGEKDGLDYYFLDAETFLTRVQAGHFLEHATVYGNSYGTLAFRSVAKSCVEARTCC